MLFFFGEIFSKRQLSINRSQQITVMSSSNLLALQSGLDGVQWEEGNIHRYSSTTTSNILNSVADLKHNNADPDPSFHLGADPDQASHQSDATPLL
jgi:hypothetical protein